VIGDQRNLHKEELRNLYFSSSVFRMMKSRKMKLAGHVTRMSEGGGEEECIYDFGGKARMKETASKI
jgi:hypothetical protein